MRPSPDFARQRLLVYGSLAPGERHHDLLAHLGGTWQAATIRGHLDRTGEYPTFTPDPTGPAHNVHLFESPELPTHWPVLDHFEGDEYQRIALTAHKDGTPVTAQIYVKAR